MLVDESEMVRYDRQDSGNEGSAGAFNVHLRFVRIACERELAGNS
jgi:hypothetical protein